MIKTVGKINHVITNQQAIKIGKVFHKIGYFVGSRSFLLHRITKHHWHFYMAVFYVLFDGPNLNRGEVRQKELRLSQNSQFFRFYALFLSSLRERHPIS